MLKIVLLLTLLCISEMTYASSGNIGVSIPPLKPSITLQMGKNTALQIRLSKYEKIRAIQARIKEKKQERIVKKSGNTLIISSAPVPVNTSKPSPLQTGLPPKILSEGNRVQNVDMDRVRTEWLSWYNTTRSSIGLSGLSYDTRLDATAHDWNIEFAAGKGQNHHRRNPGDSYYDFSVIDNWFNVRGIDPIVVNHVKHVENVGYGYYNCTSSDCTDKLIQSIRSTYDFFMSEKGKSYDAHYRSIVQPNFSKIGLDIITVPSDNRYYITIHYITE